jgi:sigma-E factor negative regulatory protein RseC
MESAAGRVVSVRDAIATVEVAAPVACRRCASGRGCGAGLLVSDRNRNIEVRIPQGLALHCGDAVRLVVDSRQIFRAALLAYGIPLAGLLLFVGAAAMAMPGGSDPAMAGLGLAGVLAGILVSRWRLGRAAICDRFVPVLERRAG